MNRTLKDHGANILHFWLFANAGLNSVKVPEETPREIFVFHYVLRSTNYVLFPYLQLLAV